MSKPRVYIETTVPNFYYDFRPSRAIETRREATRRWWAGAAERYELVTSTFVHAELAAGTSKWVVPRLALLDNVPMLLPTDAVDNIVEVYIRHKLMPAKPPEDAMHLALASYHECDFIVTWNCRHLANPNKAGHIRKVNTRLGLAVPVLVTPIELLKGAPDV